MQTKTKITLGVIALVVVVAALLSFNGQFFKGSFRLRDFIIGLNAPVLADPKPDQVYTNFPRAVLIKWYPVEGADGYYVSVECDTCGEGPWKALVFSATLYQTTGVTTSDLPSDSQYRVKVRAFNDRVKSQWSEYRYFRYSTGPDAPRQPSDVSGGGLTVNPSQPTESSVSPLIATPPQVIENLPLAMLNAPTIMHPVLDKVYANYPRKAYLEWSAVPGAVAYEVNVECDRCGQAPWKSIDFRTVVEGTTTVTTSSLSGDNRFRVRVRAFSSIAKGSWSDYRYFSYDTRLPQ